MTKRTHILQIEPSAVLVEIKQYDKTGELIAVATLLPPQDEEPMSCTCGVGRHPEARGYHHFFECPMWDSDR